MTRSETNLGEQVSQAALGIGTRISATDTAVAALRRLVEEMAAGAERPSARETDAAPDSAAPPQRER